MKKITVSIFGLLAFTVLLAGCATTADPILTPPPPPASQDQVSGVHKGLSPLYQQLKKSPPYIKKSDHWQH